MKKLSTLQKIIIFSILILIVVSSITLGCIFGAKPTITLDYGYIDVPIPNTSILLKPNNTLLSERNAPLSFSQVSRFSAYSPPRPYRKDYIFQGWYKDTAFTQPWINGTDKVKSDITLYAKWEKVG